MAFWYKQFRGQVQKEFAASTIRVQKYFLHPSSGLFVILKDNLSFHLTALKVNICSTYQA
jgi:hypothetical protein